LTPGPAGHHPSQTFRMGDLGNGAGGNRTGRGRFEIRNWGLSLGSKVPGRRTDQSFPGHRARLHGCCGTGRVNRTARLLGFEVGDVDGAPIISKAVDAPGVGNLVTAPTLQIMRTSDYITPLEKTP
jgi:hypothetical protein